MSNLIVFPGPQKPTYTGSLIVPPDAGYSPAAEDVLANNPFIPDTDENGVPNYTGRLLALNPEKANRFQCGGFFLGGKLQSNVVPDDAQMYQIHNAVRAGILLDITTSGEVRTENSSLGGVEESNTDKRVYFTTNDHGERIMLATSDPEEQRRLDAQLEAGARKLILPEGFLESEKYILDLAKPETPEPTVPRSIRARVKDKLYRLVQAL
jgi:hypothetical protein